MKQMYTNKPDDGCSEVSDGIWSRPVHTHEQSKLIKQGWVFHEKQLRQEQDEEGQKKEGSMNVYEQAAKMSIATEDDEGKKIHHKTLKKMIDKAQSND